MDEKIIVSGLSFLQAGLWVALVVWLFLRFGEKIEAFLDSVAIRIRRGDKVSTPWLSLESAPSSLRTDRPAVTTAEGAEGADRSPEIERILIDESYPETVCDSIYLVHTAAVLRERTPRQRGHYRVRLWVEAYDPAMLGDVERVSYRLYKNEFPEPVIATSSVVNNFELWLNVYGEFTVVAYVERRSAPAFWTTRYLDLPGRPPE